MSMFCLLFSIANQRPVEKPLALRSENDGFVYDSVIFKSYLLNNSFYVKYGIDAQTRLFHVVPQGSALGIFSAFYAPLQLVYYRCIIGLRLEQLKCCGANNLSDFSSSITWNKRISSALAPLTCCTHQNTSFPPTSSNDIQPTCFQPGNDLSDYITQVQRCMYMYGCIIIYIYYLNGSI